MLAMSFFTLNHSLFLLDDAMDLPLTKYPIAKPPAKTITAKITKGIIIAFIGSPARNIDVGPSAPPIIAVDEDSFAKFS